VQFRTESFTIYIGQDFAETDQKVIVDGASGRTSAAGMKAYLKEGRYLLTSSKATRVMTTLQPGGTTP
jgi:lipopolysaccharide export system protein LptC